MKSICFVTTGDIKNIATAKRALGLANPLSKLGWSVSILMEDTLENRHRIAMECSSEIDIRFFEGGSMLHERKSKNLLIREINPDFLYICAFVTRNIVGIGHRCKKLVEHSELQSGIPDMKGMRKWFCYAYEFYSLIYSDGLLNASKYLQNVYIKRSKKVLCSKLPMLYFPYAFNPDVMHIKSIDFDQDRFVKYKNKSVFVFLGSVTRNYGVFTILDAAKQLKSHSMFKVLILGRGRHYEEAKRYIQDNEMDGIVEMPGYVAEEEISTYFSLATAFISPMNDTVQDWARCPSKMYLYLPYKKPVITCKIGEPYEVLGQNGFYYTPSNSDELSMCMKEIMDKKISSIDIDPYLYSWETRANELNQWLNKTF